MENDKFEIFKKNYPGWAKDWNKFARDVGRVRLDNDQQEILHAVQTTRRVAVRSGNARGKDFIAAVSSVCFLYLTVFDEDWNFHATKVINTAPTGRQVNNIMMPEISKFHSRAGGILPGNVMSRGIRFDHESLKGWYLLGFKAGDDNVEAWTGFHAPNIMAVVTEASGIGQSTFDSIESILQGNSRLLLIFNPNRTNGEAYNSQSSPLYKKFVLNSMNAPNVVNKRKVLAGEMSEAEFKRLLIPGQVDYEWIDEKIKKPGWVFKIPTGEQNPAEFDFEWNGQWYRPSDLFRVKVLGEFPRESDEQLIPLSWIEAAQQRFALHQEMGWKTDGSLKVGVDVAGMGRDATVFCPRKGNFVSPLEVYGKSTHMETAGRVKSILSRDRDSYAIIDTIGEGAGVLSRLEEQGESRAFSCKFSETAKGLTDVTEGYEFDNMRAYLFWCVRDWLNPAFNSKACLPPDEELSEELIALTYTFKSNGKILIDPKDDVKKKIGRSPDKADSLANTFYPHLSDEADLEGVFY